MTNSTEPDVAALSEDTTTSAKEDGSRPALPMGWTQVKRRRRKPSSNGDEIEWCCNDPTCPRPFGKKRPALGLEDEPEEQGEEHVTVGKVFQGQAIICLHEFDASWFQGYFLPSNSQRPWGLLAQEEELDECLECADGGYRRVALTAFPANKKKVVWEHVEWTGGDMMKLVGSNNDISMNTNRLWTGVKAVPYVQRYFGGILDKLRNDLDHDMSSARSILELLPDIAIVIGNMRITLPPMDHDEENIVHLPNGG